MIIKSQSGSIINTLDDWFTYASPAKGELHWKDGRSAKELAKAWMSANGPKMPSELIELFATHPHASDFEYEWAIPEYETKLDDFKGKGRNHDLIVFGATAGKKTLMQLKLKQMRHLERLLLIMLQEMCPQKHAR